jgi:hypothetical protein
VDCKEDEEFRLAVCVLVDCKKERKKERKRKKERSNKNIGGFI